VVVKIEVNQTGQVISAIPGQKGTTNSATCLTDPARRAALATRFNADSNAPSVQRGFITYDFKLSD
jgi:protein TonB